MYYFYVVNFIFFKDYMIVGLWNNVQNYLNNNKHNQGTFVY